VSIANFDIKTDLFVKIGQEPLGVFILGLSELGSTDVLADSAYAMTQVEADVNHVTIERGMDTVSSVLRAVAPSIATIEMQTENYDPFYNKSIRVGQAISVSDSSSEVFFTGQIDSISVSYDPNGTMIMTLTAVDDLRDIMNTQVDYYLAATDPAYAAPILSDLFISKGHYPWSGNDQGQVARLNQLEFTDTTMGEIINTVIDSENGWLWLDRNNDEYIYLGREYEQGIGPAEFFFSNTHSSDPTHYCLNEIMLNTGTTNKVNRVKATNSWDSGFPIVVRDKDSIQLYGELSSEITVDLYNSTQLRSLAQWLMLRGADNRVSEIGTSAISNLGALTDLAYIAPASPISINFARNGNTLVNDTYIVTKVKHDITPTTWQVNLEVMRGI